jgi:acetyl-CoA synthetase
MTNAHERSLPDYETTLRCFNWADVLDELGWRGKQTVNLGETIIDRPTACPSANKTALVLLSVTGQETEISYRTLAQESARFANLLTELGIKEGDRVAALRPRGCETCAVILGVFKAGAVYVPIFSGFGIDGVRYRLEHSGAKLLVTHHAYRDQVPTQVVARILCLEDIGMSFDGDIELRAAMDRQTTDFKPVPLARDDTAAIIYTSGSTGEPKGCVIAVNMLAAIWPYIRYGVDLQAENDVFWPTGDPGWGYGLCCYLPALAAGAKVLCVQWNPKPDEFIHLLARYEVTNLATTPTLLRASMALGRKAVRRDGIKVRAISSCGEPLNAEVVSFFRDTWDVTPMDHYGATEFALPIGNYNAVGMDVKPGSMGLPSPGYEMAVVNEDGCQLPAGETGLIGQKTDENSLYWMRYWNDEAATGTLDHGGWRCTGDLARRDEDGYFWFEGRDDDMIKSAGYRIGPFEVESAILRCKAVAEAAVIGKRDSVRGEIVKAFVILKAGIEPSDALADEITAFVRDNLGKHQYPREIAFVDTLPKTETGKIRRFKLRAEA